MRTEFERKRPEETGISSQAVLDYINALEQADTEMHGLMIMRHDAVIAEDGSYISYGTWLCANCGDVTEATEGNAVYYYGQQEAAASGETSAEASSEASAEAAPAEAAPANPNYDPYAYNWASICLTVAIVIVVVGAVLMLSFGKKKKD